MSKFLVHKTLPAEYAGKFIVRKYSGYGILGANIPTTVGDNGASPALLDGIDPAAEYTWKVTQQPPNGTLTIFPDLTFLHVGGSGSSPWKYQLRENGIWQVPEVTVNDTFGAAGVTATINATESGGDSASAGVSVGINATVNAAETGQDSAGLGVNVGVTATINATENGQDTASISIVNPDAIHMDLNTQESGQDSASFTISSGSNQSVVSTSADYSLALQPRIFVSTNQFIEGDTARISMTLSQPISSVKVDPGSLILKIRKPDQTLIVLTFGVDADLVKDSVGNYHNDMVLDQAGIWRWRWEADGQYAGVAEGQLTAMASHVL